VDVLWLERHEDTDAIVGEVFSSYQMAKDELLISDWKGSGLLSK